MSRSLDLGCGLNPKNPFKHSEIFGLDIRPSSLENIKHADLAVEPIPYPDDYFDAVSAFDFLEHIPRIIYCPKRRFAFVELMNEIYRVMKIGGDFLSFTPAFPHGPAFRDPTHVNIITYETFPLYFDDKNRLASMYGFEGAFQIVNQSWHSNKFHLISHLRKVGI